MTESMDRKTLPKSMRHKQILDEAAENPEASIDDIAAAVPSATPELVERVLDEYGDPAAEDDPDTDAQSANADPTDGATADDSDMTPDDSAQDSSDSTTDDAVANGDKVSPETEVVTNGAKKPSPDGTERQSAAVPKRNDLSAKQRETLEAIAANPDATQRELAAELDVTAATVSSRVNSIEGFEWSERQSLVDEILAAETDTDPEQEGTQMPTTDIENAIGDLTARLDAIEATLEELTGEEDTENGFDDPELVQKVVHACVDSEAVSEEEELRIIQELME